MTVEGYIIDVKGRQTALPVILSYRVRHGMGVPCDSFELTCKYEPEAEDALKGGCCFLAVDREGVVFRGILDEYEAEIGLSGKLLSVSGRSMALLRSMWSAWISMPAILPVRGPPGKQAPSRSGRRPLARAPPVAVEWAANGRNTS